MTGRAPCIRCGEPIISFPRLVFGKPTDAFIDLHQPLAAAAQSDALALLLGHAHHRRLASALRFARAGPRPVRGASHRLHTLSRSHRPWPHRGQARHRAAGRQDAYISPTAARKNSISSSTLPASGQASRSWIRAYILDEQGRSKLFIHTFDREHDDLFVVGLFEPAEGGVWQLADYQAKLIASFIVALASDPKHAAWFRKLKASATPDIGHGIP